MDFPRIVLSEEANSIFDSEDGRLQVDYTSYKMKEVRLRESGRLAARRPKLSFGREQGFERALYRPADH
jgi:hypothetical protein